MHSEKNPSSIKPNTQQGHGLSEDQTLIGSLASRTPKFADFFPLQFAIKAPFVIVGTACSTK